MQFPGDHGADFELAQECLLGDERAIRTMQERCRTPLMQFLTGSGAGAVEAEEITESLFTDCTIGHGTRTARFEKYGGRCALLSWMKTIALNELISVRRRQATHRTAVEMAEGAGSNPGETGDLPFQGAVETAVAPADATLPVIMKTALQKALGECQASELVMLSLVHLKGLTQREVAELWRWDEPRISRALRRTMQHIAERTLRHARATDPWLEIGWRDFVQLCQTADSSLFE